MFTRLRQPAHVPDGRERQDALNQPWEFEEAVLSPKDMARIRRGPAGNALFEEAGALKVSEFRLRELAVRLRTINNACDASAQLPDGRPLTEVSLYGSRERQYLVAPYPAVRKLMKGIRPETDELTSGLAQSVERWEAQMSVLRPWWAQLKAEPDQSWPVPFEVIYQVTAPGLAWNGIWKSMPAEKQAVSWSRIVQGWKVEDEKLRSIDEYLSRENPFLELQERMRSSETLRLAQGQWWFTFHSEYETVLDEFHLRKKRAVAEAHALFVFLQWPHSGGW